MQSLDASDASIVHNALCDQVGSILQRELTLPELTPAPEHLNSRRGTATNPINCCCAPAVVDEEAPAHYSAYLSGCSRGFWN